MKEDEDSVTVCCLLLGVCAGLLSLAGYNVELIVKRDHVLEMTNLVMAQLTGATLKGGPFEVEDGILLLYNLPPQCHADIAPFFRVLENESQIADILLDYSISQTTLEEVFMNVSYPCLQ